MQRIALALTLLACCSKPSEIDGLPEGARFPYVLAGKLMVTVEEGEPGSDSISSVNFGELMVGDQVYLVTVAGDVVRRAGLSRNAIYAGRPFRVTLTGIDPVSESTGVPSYVVGELVPLD